MSLFLESARRIVARASAAGTSATPPLAAAEALAAVVREVAGLRDTGYAGTPERGGIAVGDAAKVYVLDRPSLLRHTATDGRSPRAVRYGAVTPVEYVPGDARDSGRVRLQLYLARGFDAPPTAHEEAAFYDLIGSDDGERPGVLRALLAVGHLPGLAYPHDLDVGAFAVELHRISKGNGHHYEYQALGSVTVSAIP